MTQAAAKEVVTQPGSEISVVNLDINSEKIAELALRFNELPKDPDNENNYLLGDENNYRLTQNIINEAREMRGKIKDAGKGLKEDAAKWQKKVVAEEKRLDGEITTFLDPLAARKKIHDDEVKAEKERLKKVEQARKDTHLANINGIRILISKAQGQPSEKIEEVIAELEAMAVEGFYTSFEEFEDEAGGVYDDTEFALNKLLLDAQTQEEADRKRAEEDERLRKERKKLDDEKAENERIRLKNEEVAKENEKNAQELEQKAADPAPQSEPEQEVGIKTIQPSASNVSPAVQAQADDDKSVISQAERNTEDAIFNVIADGKFLNEHQVAASILRAIRAGEIPNVKYDIF